MGYRLVRVRLSGQNGLTLQIMAERDDGSMTVEDCEARVAGRCRRCSTSKIPIDRAYHLESFLAGHRSADGSQVGFFTRWIGHLLKCETSVMVADRKRFPRPHQGCDGGRLYPAARSGQLW